MRLVIVALVAILGCSGSKSGVSHPGVPDRVAKEYPATRWIPANPTYVLASPTVKEAQRALRDVIDSFGVIAGIEVSEVGRELARVLAVDPLSPDALSGMGIDLNGGFAVFSEELAPTFVVHLAAPEATQAFFDGQRERGLVTQSVIVDGTEIFTAQLLANVKVSWAVANDWLWVHFTLPFAHEDAQAWFTSSHRPEGGTWSKDWVWAQQAAGGGPKPSLVGFLDPKDMLSAFTSKVPDAIACAKLLAPIQRIAVSVEGDGKRAAGRLALDIGPSAAGVTGAILPQPEGFAAVASSAPLAAQWNVDLLTVRAWAQPCLASLDEDLAMLDRFGVRSARVVLQSFDPDQKTGAGALAMDLAHKRYFASRLDDIPARSIMERSRTFGPFKGHSLSVPFVASIDYVLTDALALAAVGDGLMMRVIGTGGMVKGPVAAIDIAPPGLSAEAWKMMFEAVGLRRADKVVERLLRWRDGHVSLAIEGSSLVLSASGNRR